jgi:hypothetical protein
LTISTGTSTLDWVQGGISSWGPSA